MLKSKKFWLGLAAAVLSAAGYFLYQYWQGEEQEPQPVEVVEETPAETLQ